MFRKMEYKNEDVERYGWKLKEILEYIYYRTIPARHNVTDVTNELIRWISIKISEENIKLRISILSNYSTSLKFIDNHPAKLRGYYYDFKIYELYNSL